jgi:hypothetical protein
LIRPTLRAVAAGAALVLTAACATAPAIPFQEPRELAGTWRGRLTGRSGSAVASLTVNEDGSFTGTMYLDGEDKDFSGVIAIARPGHAFYRSSEGFGTVVLQAQGGTRTLRFQPDGGGVASTFAPSP